MIVLVIKLTIFQNMFTLYKKGSHTIRAREDGEKAYIQGLGGLDSIELMILLIENGYQVVR